MKIRGGFVSNSSSSSFIVALKNDGDELTVESLVKAFKVPSDSPVFDLIEEMASTIVNRVRAFDKDDLESDYAESIEELLGQGNREAQLINEGFTVYRGTMCDEDGGIEAMLCYTTIDCETEDMVICGGGGY